MTSEPYKTTPVLKTATLWQKEAAQPPLATPQRLLESRALATNFAFVNFTLRLLLCASALVGVLLMVTSKQTELVPIPIYPYQAPRSANFKHSPALRYCVSALSAVGCYSIISGLFSFFALSRPGSYQKMLYLGIVATATGIAGGVAYIGLKGNSHTGWQKICNTFDKFCRHIGASVVVSLVASILLTLLVLFSVRFLSKKKPK